MREAIRSSREKEAEKLSVYTAFIHAVAGCEESASCFTLKRFGFAHLALNLLKGVFLALVFASLKCHYDECRWQDAG